MKRELRLSGSGGQGLILAGIILAEAAIKDGLNALQSQSYGPEARGGASKAEVIISDDEINFPKVRKPDIILALTQKALDTYALDLNENSILVVDDSLHISDNIGVGKVYKLPIINTATNKIGKTMVANIVALGVIGEILQVVEIETLKEAILQRVPEGTEKLNMTALEEGVQLVKNS